MLDFPYLVIISIVFLTPIRIVIYDLTYVESHDLFIMLNPIDRVIIYGKAVGIFRHDLYFIRVTSIRSSMRIIDKDVIVQHWPGQVLALL